MTPLCPVIFRFLLLELEWFMKENKDIDKKKKKKMDRLSIKKWKIIIKEIILKIILNHRKNLYQIIQIRENIRKSF